MILSIIASVQVVNVISYVLGQKVTFTASLGSILTAGNFGFQMCKLIDHIDVKLFLLDLM